MCVWFESKFKLRSKSQHTVAAQHAEKKNIQNNYSAHALLRSTQWHYIFVDPILILIHRTMCSQL